MKGYTHKKYRKKRHTVRRKRSSGGRAIDAGSYGCVFNPAIKCAKSAQPYNPKNIAKLMYIEDTQTELDEMVEFVNIWFDTHFTALAFYFFLHNTVSNY